MREELESVFINLEGTPKKFEKEILSYIEKVIGQKLTIDVSVYIERFVHDGMSSGALSGYFWFAKGIPLLVERYK